MPGARRSASCQGAAWTCVKLYDDGAYGGVGCIVPRSARTYSQAHRRTLSPPWACIICCAEPVRHRANQHVDGGGGDVVQLRETSASTTDNAKRVGFVEDEAVLIPLVELELGNAISKRYDEALTELTSFGMSIMAPSFSKMPSVTINLLTLNLSCGVSGTPNISNLLLLREPRFTFTA